MRGQDDFEAAFDRLLGLAYRHARRLVGDAALAEDLAAEALTRTYVRWPKVRTYEFLDAWVLRVVTNLAIDALSSPRRRCGGERRHRARGRGVVARDAWREALRALPTRQRDAVVLRYLVDMSEADVASALGVAPGTVKSHLNRAVTRLRTALGPTFDLRLEEW